jgi:propionate CoA-transferase
VAPGIDVERDIRPVVEFDLRISPDVKVMDPRLFLPGLMGLKDTEGWK